MQLKEREMTGRVYNFILSFSHFVTSVTVWESYLKRGHLILIVRNTSTSYNMIYACHRTPLEGRCPPTIVSQNPVGNIDEIIDS